MSATHRRVPATSVSLALALILAACASATPSNLPSTNSSAGLSAAETPSRSPTSSFASTTPSYQPPVSTTAQFSLLPSSQPASFTGRIACSGPIGSSDPVAVVHFTGTEAEADHPPQLALRDYADWSHPRTACTFDDVGNVQLIDAHHALISYGPAVVDLPEVRFHWFDLPPDTYPSFLTTFIAVSPGLDQVVWLSYRAATVNDYNTMRQIHVTQADGDTVVASLVDEPTGFCGAPVDVWTRGAYSSSGEHLFYVDQLFDGFARSDSLRVFDRAPSTVYTLTPPSGGWPEGDHPAMAAWAPGSETLYYRQGDTVWRWTPGAGVESFLSGVRWSVPTFTPDGKHFAYGIPTSDFAWEIYVGEVGNAVSPHSIGLSLNPPVFLNDAQLWLERSGTNLGCAGPGSEQRHPVIYNITDGSEARSIIDGVGSVWPGRGPSY
jgi:hypothetical protein